MKKNKKAWVIAAVALSLLLVAAAAVTALLYYEGYIWFNEPSREEYPVRGIDISEHQGTVDWEPGACRPGMTSSSSRPPRAWTTWTAALPGTGKQAGAAGMTRGAYHFFTFRSPGLEQARNFIANVPVEAGCLPPAVDIELGGNSVDVPDRESFRRELDDFLGEVEATYGRKPILYVNDESYERFIMGAYEEYPVWNADVFWSPGLADSRSWLFWQYSPRGRVDGIDGYVDLDVFNGTPEEFTAFVAAE